MRRWRIRSVQFVLLLALTFLASAPVAADEASCAALCQMMKAYCQAAGGELDGVCMYDHIADTCTLWGCWLNQNQ